MAKKSMKPNRRYSSCDQCLIQLLLEPVKRYKTKQSDITKVKQSEELLRSIVFNELISNVSKSSSSSSAAI